MDLRVDAELSTLKAEGAAFAQAHAQDADFFEALARSPLGRMAIPPALGGRGLSPLELAFVLEGFGESTGDPALCIGAAAQNVVVPLALAACGTPHQLERAAEERYMLSLLELSTEQDGAGATLVAKRRAGHWVLDGSKPLVVGSSHATALLVTAAGRQASDGERTAFLVPCTAEGLTREPAQGRTTTFHFDACLVDDTHVLGAPGAAGTRVTALLERLERSLLLAPWLGVMRRLVQEMAHSLDEEAVTRGRGKLSQSQRLCYADAVMHLELCANLVYRAAWAQQQPSSAQLEGASAKWFVLRALGVILPALQKMRGLGEALLDPETERIASEARVLERLGGGSDALTPLLALSELRP